MIYKTTNPYKLEMRKKRRGGHCIFGYTDANGVGRSCFCGCGYREAQTKKFKKRIVRRVLKRRVAQLVRASAMSQD